MEAVFKQLKGPSQIALPAVGVAGQQQVEGSSLRRVEHLGHRRRTPDRGPALGDLEDETRVEQAMALDESVLLLAVAGGTVAVELAGRRLADPASDAEAADLVDGARQTVQAAGGRFGSITTGMFPLRASPSSRRATGPSG